MKTSFLSSLKNRFAISFVDSTSEIPSTELIREKLGLWERDNWIFSQIKQSFSGSVVVDAHLFNRDGSLAGFSGNGFACLASLLSKENNVNKVEVCSLGNSYSIETPDPRKVRLKLRTFQWIDNKYRYETKLLSHYQEGIVSCGLLDLGNEHFVVLFDTDWLSNKDFSRIQSEFFTLSSDREIFPDGINMGLASINNRTGLDLIVHERGCGLTPACSSGALAAVIVANKRAGLEAPLNVSQNGGDCTVDFDPVEDGYILVLSPQEDAEVTQV